MYRTIIVPVALTGAGVGRGLVERARRLLDPGGTIVLCHVMEEVPGYITVSLPREKLAERRKEAFRKLESLGNAARGQKVELDLRSGNAPMRILDAAKEYDADLIIIGSHQPGLSDYFIGSTAARVVRHAPVSVLVLR